MHVRCLVRSREKAAASIPAPGEHVDWVYGSVQDEHALDQLTASATAIVHTIGIRRELPPDVTYTKLHPGATRVVIAAARRNDVDRFIHISALGTRPDAACAYHQSKYESEQLVRSSGLLWTILRPSLIHGADGEFVQMVKDWALGRAAPWFFMPWFAKAEVTKGFPPRPPMPVSAQIQPISVDDVALAVERALERDEAIGEVYPLTGPETYDWPELLRSIRDAVPLADGRKKPVPIPGMLGVVQAGCASKLGIAAALPFGPSEPRMAMEDSIASTAKVEQHLGFEPQPFADALAQYASEI